MCCSTPSSFIQRNKHPASQFKSLWSKWAVFSMENVIWQLFTCGYMAFRVSSGIVPTGVADDMKSKKGVLWCGLVGIAGQNDHDKWAQTRPFGVDCTCNINCPNQSVKPLDFPWNVWWPCQVMPLEVKKFMPPANSEGAWRHIRPFANKNKKETFYEHFWPKLQTEKWTNGEKWGRDMLW